MVEEADSGNMVWGEAHVTYTYTHLASFFLPVLFNVQTALPFTTFA